ncbi:hypothetical protein T484DRAFT_1838737 [Baffinella frigidus]|nr:hypothetical protein T484DRAFT_1838737 [Cryptophyta sp. CCMP2293]
MVQDTSATKLAYLDMMRTASHGDDDSFYDLMARLNSTRDLPANRSCSAPSSPKTPSRFEKKNKNKSPGVASSADRSPSSPGTPPRLERVISEPSSRLERVIFHMSSASSTQASPAASSAPSSPTTPSHFERTCTAPRSLLPPPGGAIPERLDSSEHRDSAVFLARMLTAQSKKTLKDPLRKKVERMRIAMKEWSSARPPS